MTETLRDSPRAEWGTSEAPKYFGKGRLCTMGKRCQVWENTPDGFEPEVGRVSGYTEPHQEAGDDVELILLCGECERLRIRQGKTPAEFQGTQKKGRVTAYPLPNLRVIRLDRDLFRRELGRMAGCSPDTIAGIEDKKTNCSSKIAGKLATALGVTIEDLRRK